ncbi:hypothetical protein RchiOBHm_Chr6g0245121 [Rosa chinensis]|uniref:Uncharacterized protein n=1 Tax=Rosa chinensis TaxID=74649 RepID=A0A2P6PJ73_ROSCH|nr:hypothetical protein RchiOBHm_Chr6g0245121 [Rosa chinensis]
MGTLASQGSSSHAHGDRGGGKQSGLQKSNPSFVCFVGVRMLMYSRIALLLHVFGFIAHWGCAPETMQRRP